MKQLAEWLDQCLRAPEDDASLKAIRDDVISFCGQFPVPGIGNG